jgi:ketosteroid isomerase-like protein
MRQIQVFGSFGLIVLWISLTLSGWTCKSSDVASLEERDALIKADTDFDKATAEKGIEGWVACFAENGSMLTGTDPPITGHEAIRKAMEGAFKNPDFSLRWQPTRAEVLIPGVLGYTAGRYERRAKNQDGKKTLGRGMYVSVWKKQPDKSWKIVLDTGNPDGPPDVVE